MMYQTRMETLPPIIVSGTEERRLSALAAAAELTGRTTNSAQTLLGEMNRAHVMADSEVPRGVVRMDSFVEFDIDGRYQQPVRLVYPAEADISRGKISVLTPIGAALIGLSAGQHMLVEAPDGKMHKVRVLSVMQPASRSSEAVLKVSSAAEVA